MINKDIVSINKLYLLCR